MKKTNPYDILKPYGIGPSSTMAEIDQCVFSIMRQRNVSDAGPELDAVQKLKDPVNRLSIDFLLPEANTAPDFATIESFIAKLPPGRLPESIEEFEKMGIDFDRLISQLKSEDNEQLRFAELLEELL